MSVSARLVAGLGIGLLAGAAELLAGYPLSPWPLGAALVLYALLLWMRPGAWLLVLPVVVPNLQLAPWTGRMLPDEGDLFVLVSLGVLAIRAPPRLVDLRLGRGAGLAALAVLASVTVSLGRGLAVAEPPGGTSLLYMSAANGVHLVLPMLEAALLVPFAARQQRLHGDALSRFAWGMTLGLCLTALLAGAERLAFVGLGSFGSDYRVAFPFASMHVGGGHIGAYLAMALPFSIVVLQAAGRARWPVFAAVLALGLGALALTFARTAYAAGAVGALATGLAVQARRRGALSAPARAAALAVGLGVAAALVASPLAGGFMQARLHMLGPDLATRLANWQDGLQLAGDGPGRWLFGSGTGTYLRKLRARATAGASPETAPADFVAMAAGGRTFLRLRGGPPLYVGQKLDAQPGEPLTFSVQARSAASARLAVLLCEKYLLFAMNCADAWLATGPDWTTLRAPLALGRAESLDRPVLPRPVELSLLAPPGAEIDVTGLRLVGPDGRDRVRNGSFAEGTDRWFFTADNHVGWRILNQYLMSLLETGMFGLLAWLGLFAAGLAGAWRARAWVAAAWPGAAAALAISFLFDAVLEAPALVWLVVMMLGLGLVAGRSTAQEGPAPR